MSTACDLIIIGGGEHACVIADAARSRPGIWNVAGFVDTRERTDTAVRLQTPQFTEDDAARSMARGARLIMGIGRIGSCALRRALVARYLTAGATWATIAHATAWVSPSAMIGAGTVILAGAVLNSGSRIGMHCVLNTGAIIEHDVSMGDFSHAAPGAIVGGAAEIGEDCYLGLGCRVRDHIRVGGQTTIGMGAVVLQSLPSGVQAYGVPARISGHDNSGGV